MRAIKSFLIWLAAFSANPVQAAKLLDCPLRDRPFSTNTPLVDIMLSPAASAVLDTEMPGALKGFPPSIASTTPPTFAAILDIRKAAGFRGDVKLDLGKIDRALAAVPVTRADKEARCARYDSKAPKFDIPAGKKRILLFEKINGFKDTPSVNGAHAAFIEIAKRNGWAIVTTENGAAFTPSILKKFDTVIWNNISGDVLTLSQRRAFQNYMSSGGGFIGVHGTAGDPIYFWDWYVDSLIGARFTGHPRAKQFQTAKLNIDDAAHPVAAGLPAHWEMNDEWYSFQSSPRKNGSHIIATIDENTYEQTMGSANDLQMGDHPIAWTRCVGKGRSFYSAIGHRPERYSDAIYVKMLENAIDWSMDNKAGDCSKSRKAKK